MDAPPLVRERLGDEPVRARVAIGGDDAAFVTPTRTLVYRADGLLSDESVSSFPHDVERLDLSVGRRKATFQLGYVDGEESFRVPADRADAVLEALFGEVLAAAGVTGPEEELREVYRFSELTLALTDGHLVKHVGGVLWDDDYELFALASVTGLGAEEGDVATQLVVEVDGRPHRVKVPSERAELVRRAVEAAVFEYHGVDSLAALREAQGVEDEPAPEGAATFEEDAISPLVDAGGDDGEASADEEAEPGGAGGSTSVASGRTGAASGSADAEPVAGERDDGATGDGATDDTEATRPAGDGPPPVDIDALHDRIDALEAAVERQTELLERQQQTVETLVEELRRGR